MSPEMARHRSALRLAFAATLALTWGTMAGERLPGLTAVLAAQILVGVPRPPRPGQAVALIVVIAITGGAAFAITSVFSDRLLMLTAALGLLFFLGFAMRERAAGRSSLPATMLLNATAVVPVLTFQAEILGAGVIETLVTAAIRATLVVLLLYALFPAPQEEVATGTAGRSERPRCFCRRHIHNGRPPRRVARRIFRDLGLWCESGVVCGCIREVTNGK